MNAMKSGSKDYPNDGYVVKWDSEGLTIETTDYHAGTLRLPWKEILALSKIAMPQENPRKWKRRKK